MEEQDKIEAEDTDVEGHKHVISRAADAEDAAAARTRHASDESDDDPDVEGHRHVAPKVVPPRTVN